MAGSAMQLAEPSGMQWALEASDSSEIEREALWELHAEQYRRVSRCDLLSQCRPEGKTLHCMARQEGRMIAVEMTTKGARHGEQPFDQLDTFSKLCLKEDCGDCDGRKDDRKAIT